MKQLRARIYDGEPCYAEVDDGSGWRLVPKPWSFDADRRGPLLDLYLRYRREVKSGTGRRFWLEPKLPEPCYTLTCAKLGYEQTWVDSVEYIKAP